MVCLKLKVKTSGFQSSMAVLQMTAPMPSMLSRVITMEIMVKICFQKTTEDKPDYGNYSFMVASFMYNFMFKYSVLYMPLLA